MVAYPQMITGNANNNFEETYTVIRFHHELSRREKGPDQVEFYGIDFELGSVQFRFCQQFSEALEISQCTFPGRGH